MLEVILVFTILTPKGRPVNGVFVAEGSGRLSISPQPFSIAKTPFLDIIKLKKLQGPFCEGATILGRIGHREKGQVMGTAEYFSDLLGKIGLSNFLIPGIVIIVLWLLISGIRKGLGKRDDNKEDHSGHEG